MPPHQTKHMLTLPKADMKGNYWFGKPGAAASAAILPKLCDDHGNYQPGGQAHGYFISLGEKGMVWDGVGSGLAHLSIFKTPQLALDHLADLLKHKDA